ncbi:MAG: hypothetical protein LBD14_03650 [Puniceicoccales bacterium]|nr:hypothetical protein [Puniceicoccales bacterium]
MIFFISPGLQIDIGREKTNRLTITARERLLAYVDHDNLNTQLASVNATYVYDAQSRLSAKITGSFEQASQNDNTSSGNFTDDFIIERNYYRAGVLLDYKLTDKSLFEAGFNYDGEFFVTERARFNDRQTYSVPVSWLYSAWEKLFIGMTYTYSHTDIRKAGWQKNWVPTLTNPNPDADPGSQDVHFIGLSVRGPLSEKISLSANAGVGYQDFRKRSDWLGGSESGTTFNFSVAAEYSPTERLSTKLEAGRRFDVGSEAQGITNTFFHLNANYYINQRWQVGGDIGFSYQSFDNAAWYGVSRTDEIFTAGLDLTFLPTKYWRFNVGYSYVNNHSNYDWAHYSINRVRFSASLKY